MINQKESRVRKFGNQGFTLIEILIVVMVLGILAMVIVPQITVSTTDAKQSTLDTNLVALRNALELYYVEHDSTYPGMTTDAGVAITTGWATASAAPTILQLTQFTEVNGKVSTTKTAAAKYGPYIKGDTLPANPFSATAVANAVKCGDSAIITVTTTDATTGWMYYPQIGKILANHL